MHITYKNCARNAAVIILVSVEYLNMWKENININIVFENEKYKKFSGNV